MRHFWIDSNEYVNWSVCYLGCFMNNPSQVFIICGRVCHSNAGWKIHRKGYISMILFLMSSQCYQLLCLLFTELTLYQDCIKVLLMQTQQLCHTNSLQVIHGVTFIMKQSEETWCYFQWLCLKCLYRTRVIFFCCTSTKKLHTVFAVVLNPLAITMVTTGVAKSTRTENEGL